MTLIVVVTALVLDKLMGGAVYSRSNIWFERYRVSLSSLLPAKLMDGLHGVGLILLPIFVITLLVQYLLLGVMGGVFSFVFAVFILLYCLGALELTSKVERYLSARVAGERHNAREAAEALAGKTLNTAWRSQSSAVTQAILYEAVLEIFAPIFWFVLLGPAGALLYKASILLAKQSREQHQENIERAADWVWGILGWLPFRLVALTYFLAGSFDDALSGWRKTTAGNSDIAAGNRDVLVKTGCGAMRHEVADLVAEESPDEDHDLQWVKTASHLVFRTLIIWVAILAALTLAGWAV